MFVDQSKLGELGGFLLGEAKNVISRAVDMEFSSSGTPFADPIPRARGEDGSNIVAGQPTKTSVAGVAIPPMVMVAAAVLGVLILVYALKR